MSQSIYSQLGICPARLGTFCSCGRCRKIIARHAAKAGVHPAAFLDNLGLAPARKEGSRVARANRGDIGRVVERMTVSTRGGEQSTGSEALVKALVALGSPSKKSRGRRRS